MSSILMVPIHLDALYLKSERAVVEAMADFSRIPYFNGKWDVNPDTANISEEIVSQPFQNQNLWLKAGIHLHWSLPDALTKSVGIRIVKKQTFLKTFDNGDSIWDILKSQGWIKEIDSTQASVISRDKGTTNKLWNSFDAQIPEIETILNQPLGSSFPPVPNRWLVTRSGGNFPMKQWVVESDYLYPESQSSQSGSVTIPYKAAPTKMPYQPFRYLGRKMPLEAWQKDDSSAEYLDELTAVGYGEPTFAAFYPNCHSVFGFYDDDSFSDEKKLKVLQYEVIGWYANSEQDYFKTFIQNLKNQEVESDPGKRLEAIKAEFQWTFTTGSDETFPERMLCYAQLTFAPEDHPDNSDKNAKVEIAVGNTGTEALSAYLAEKTDSTHKSIIEEQLEALHLSVGLEHRQLDIGPKFNEARHEKGFTAVGAGTLWTIRLESKASAANAADAHALEQITRSEMTASLNDLNRRQQKYDRALQEIESRRVQLFSDWYKYMLCAYPPDDSRDDYPDIDEVKYYIEVKGLDPLNAKVNDTGKLSPPIKENVTTPSASDSGHNSLASELATAISSLLGQISDYNKTLKNSTITLKQISSPRYWQPNAPVVLVIGDAVKPTPRHGQDGRLRVDGLLECQVWSDASFEEIISSKNFTAIQDKISSIKLKVGNQESIAFSTWKHQPWHPFLLEWEVEIFPIKAQGNLNPESRGYEEHFITNNYTLNENQPDFSVKPGKGLSKAANVYSGSCILTPYAQIKLKQELEAALLELVEPSLLQKFYTEKKIKPENQNKKWLEQKAKELIKWYIDAPEFAGESNWLEKFYQDESIEKKNQNKTWLLEHIHVFISWSWLRFNVREKYIKQKFYTNDNVLADNQNDTGLWGNAAQFISWFKKQPNISLELFYEDECIQKEDQNDNYLEQHIDWLINWYAKQIKNGSHFTELIRDFISWLKEQINDLTPFYQEQKVPEAQQNDAYLQENVNLIVAWYQTKIKNIYQVVTLGKAYKKLVDLNCLSQALGGFNRSLLMHKQTMQLDIADPLGFEDYQKFTQDVSKAVGKSLISAPSPLNDFNPIRSGAMAILRLQLIDTFGQVKVDLEPRQLITTELMTLPDSYTNTSDRDWIYLPPRLVQPARLNFRWLSASQGKQEMNDHPATTPICGWLLPNNLDNSLMVYDAGGKALGSINRNADWESAPGSDEPVQIDNITNSYLRNIVQNLTEDTQGAKEQKRAFLNNFISALNSALENIDPENFAQHQDLALLMGRPIAVVRASVNLELQGLPAIHQGWNVFRQDMRRNTRETDKFIRVKFPIRLGEYQQLNDALVGYWQEKADGSLSEVFYTPQRGNVNDSRIQTYTQNPLNLCQSVADPLQFLTMLIDPRGKVHATCGILPTKAIDIPPDQYTDVLRKIEITFLSTPILTDSYKLNLPLPEEPGYTWSWLQKERDIWSEISSIGTVKKQVFITTFNNDGQTIWERLQHKGWIKVELDPTKARVTPKDQRTEASLGDDMKEKEPKIEDILERSYIGKVNLKAAFSGQQVLREGWLKLSQIEESL